MFVWLWNSEAMSSNEYKLIAIKFLRGDDLTEYERDLVIDASKALGFDPYSVTESYLARNLEAFERD